MYTARSQHTDHAHHYNYTLHKRRSDETLRPDQRSDALLRAAAEGQTHRVRYLIHLGVDLDHSDDQNFTALHHAALSGFEDVVDVLREAGADVNAQSLDCGTPLHLAAIKGRSHVIEMLLRFRANPNATSRLLGSPLHCACFSGNMDAVSAFLNANAEVDRRCVLSTDLLNRMGASPHLPRARFYQCQPLHLAVSQNHIIVYSTLVENKASVHSSFDSWAAEDGADIGFDDPRARLKRGGKTTLSTAAQRGNCDMCRAILRNGAAIDAEDDRGVTALMQAAMNGHDPALEVLIEHGAVLDSHDDCGMSALHHAARTGYTDCIRLLCHHGASVDTTDDLRLTPLHHAAKRGRVRAVRRLIETGANVDTFDAHHHTPLHLAWREGVIDVVRLLLEHGADPSARDRKSRTPLEYAQLKSDVSDPPVSEGLSKLLDSITLKQKGSVEHTPSVQAYTRTNGDRESSSSTDAPLSPTIRSAHVDEPVAGAGSPRSSARASSTFCAERPDPSVSLLSKDVVSSAVKQTSSRNVLTQSAFSQESPIARCTILGLLEKPLPDVFREKTKPQKIPTPIQVEVNIPVNVLHRLRYVGLTSRSLFLFQSADAWSSYTDRGQWQQLCKESIDLKHIASLEISSRQDLHLQVRDKRGKALTWEFKLTDFDLTRLVLSLVEYIPSHSYTHGEMPDEWRLYQSEWMQCYFGRHWKRNQHLQHPANSASVQSAHDVVQWLESNCFTPRSETTPSVGAVNSH